MPPLVVTLRLDPASQEVFDRLRAAHFPPARNHLAAHVTLFHALPGDRLVPVAADLAAAASRQPAFPVRVAGLRSLGGGVAYDLASPELERLRGRLAARWSPWLTRQDAGGWRPHVTVQNKVPPAAARLLLGDLRAVFEPWSATAEGLSLWWYRGGPWERIEVLPFAPEVADAAPAS